MRSSTLTALARTSLVTAMLALCSLASGCSSSVDDTETGGGEDELVATFDKTSNIDLRVRSHILLVGDSDELNTLPLYAAMTKARPAACARGQGDRAHRRIR